MGLVTRSAGGQDRQVRPAGQPGRKYLRSAWVGAALLLLLLGACRGLSMPQGVPVQETEAANLPPPQIYTPSPSSTTLLGEDGAASATSPGGIGGLPQETPSATAPPAFTPTPDPYAGLSIEELVARSYGGGKITVHEVLAENSFFTRYLISYPSDGLEIYGFMNVPRRGEPPYPVIIALHGYIDPAIYQTLDYTTGYADALAVAGFLVLHPNLRGYPPSDDGENLFRVGMAEDVLNLIALVREWGGQAGGLEPADPTWIGLWGHSMGGGITTRVITVDPEIRAAVLYGAMSGDERKNFERIFNYFSDGTRGMEELTAPPEVFERISPVFYLERIQAAVSIHHGTDDGEVPLEWAEDTCARLQELGKEVECFTYPGQPHTFRGEGNDLFIQRVIDFYLRHLTE